MPLLVVGSVAFDTVQTPHGVVENALGGSATFFSYSSSFFTPVRLVGVVGEDFPEEHRAMLESRKVDGLVLNDGEARMLTEEINLVRAGYKVLEMGPQFVIIKKGEHGAMFLSKGETFVMPAFPVANVIDPTGAGDSFAGGFMGYL